MEWFYAENNQQKGPVSEQQLLELVHSGVIRGNTLIWRNGMASWLPYEQVMGELSGSGPTPPPMGQESTHSTSTNAEFTSALPTPEVWAERVKNEDYTLRVGECLNLGWDAIKKNFLIILVSLILIFVTNFVVSIIPILGILGQVVCYGPLMGGLWNVFIRSSRNEDVRLGDSFAGFGPSFLSLLLAGIIFSLINFLCMVPLLIALFVSVISAGVKSLEQFEQAINKLPPNLLLLVAASFLLSFVLMMTCSFIFNFVYALIIDKGVEVTRAFSLCFKKVTQHFFSVVLLTLVASIVMMSGVFLCGLGLLITVPLFFGTMAAAYEKIFPGKTNHQS